MAASARRRAAEPRCTTLPAGEPGVEGLRRTSRTRDSHGPGYLAPSRLLMGSVG